MTGTRAQTTIEYAVLIGVIVAGLIGMQVYLKRGLQGRLRSSADEISGGFVYSPGATNSDYRIATTVNEQTKSYSKDHPADGEVKVNISDSVFKSSRTSSRDEEVLPFQDEPRRQ